MLIETPPGGAYNAHNDAIRADFGDGTTPMCFVCLIKSGNDCKEFSQVSGETCAICGNSGVKALYMKPECDAAEQSTLKCLELEATENEIMAMGFKTTKLIAALDSGAGEHVAGPEDVAGLTMRESAGSKAGRHFIAANGDRIANIGEVAMTLKSKTGATFNSVFQIADVTRPLYSVGRICDAGCEVTFNNEQAVVRKSGKVMSVFKRQGGLYIADLDVMNDEPKNDGTAQPFTRQGAAR